MSGGIELTAIDKFYDNGFHAVRSLSLTIAPGELMVLVGPSGCGKTTTLRMIAGLEEVSAGSIRIADREVSRLAPKDRDIAMVFQNYALYPHMTVFDNMAYALRLRRRSKKEIREIVERAAERLDLVAQLNKRPKQLSGGQRQRVALGRAIVRQPAAFLFDEPLSNLDAKLRGSMRFEIKSLQRDLATTAVYVTHDQVEAMTLGDRITVMHQGRIQQVDDPIAVYQRPANRFVAEFIGTPPMNIVDGALDGPQDAPVFVAAGGIRWPVQPADPAAWSSAERQSCSLGVRPEHLHLADAPGVAADWPRLTVTVRLIEVLGDHRYLYVGLPDQDRVWIVKANASGSLAIGDPCEIAIDSRQGHCFAGRDETAPNRSLATSAIGTEG